MLWKSSERVVWQFPDRLYYKGTAEPSYGNNETFEVPQIYVLNGFVISTYSMNKGKHVDSLKFALFLSFMNAIYKGVLCLMRRFSKDDRINASVAGALSALSILLDNADRRKFIVLMIFSRALVSKLYFLFIGYGGQYAGQ